MELLLSMIIGGLFAVVMGTFFRLLNMATTKAGQAVRKTITSSLEEELEIEEQTKRQAAPMAKASQGD